MKLYAGATDDQYINMMLKQTYTTLKPILINPDFQEAINDCISISIKDNEKDLEDLVKKCSKYSFISFFKDLYLLPKNIDYLSIYLIIIIVILFSILIALCIITFNLSYK